ncbi:polysaccharide biosynthesis/export family protein [Synechococcus sp. M16.1]|uniref:polysaccharide biosynthesis/export family protein n=1 Tax=Synechococcus sp. M16.1 TaxID=1442553 RepID=UPI0021083B6C|nr:polysaccharide biosynthesis/export family protein [Synechococcus sp. M16.1]
MKAKRIFIGALLAFAGIIYSPCAKSEENKSLFTNQLIPKRVEANFNNEYILGSGDILEIELVDIPDLSGQFFIGPDGTIYLPRLRALNVEGMTVDELQSLLTIKYKEYLIDPQVYVRPVAYRPIRVYVGGEVKRPGYYTLSGNQSLTLSNNQQLNQIINDPKVPYSGASPQTFNQPQLNITRSTFSVFPTIFDAIQNAQGITPYSKLSEVQVTRRKPQSKGGGRIRTELNFLSLITEGDESQNIRLFDGDVVNVGKSQKVLLDQLIKAGKSNLTPEFMQVYVTGRVKEPGPVILPQGSSLVHAVDLAGGTQVLHGKVEFIRFTRASEMDRRIFGLNSDTPSGDYRNPVLMAGDVIRIRETPLTKSVAVINELTTPVLGVYSLYSIFEDFSN